MVSSSAGDVRVRQKTGRDNTGRAALCLRHRTVRFAAEREAGPAKMMPTPPPAATPSPEPEPNPASPGAGGSPRGLNRAVRTLTRVRPGKSGHNMGEYEPEPAVMENGGFRLRAAGRFRASLTPQGGRGRASASRAPARSTRRGGWRRSTPSAAAIWPCPARTGWRTGVTGQGRKP